MPRTGTPMAAARREVHGRRKLPTREAAYSAGRRDRPQEQAWPWLMLAAVLVLVALIVVDGTAGTIIRLRLHGPPRRGLIGRNDPAPPRETSRPCRSLRRLTAPPLGTG